MRYVTTKGNIVELRAEKRLGRGGEGEVLPVVHAPGLVAKVLKEPTPERRAKLEAMIRNPLFGTPARPTAAWPQDILFTAGRSRSFIGYLMPRVAGAHPMFECYNPEARRTTCPGIDYRFLVRSGRNLATAIALTHARGYVIGDVNESNALVSADAQVTLIDTDSWQIHDSVRRATYRCPVGKPEFMAPELQGTDLRTVDRSATHDQFALAVLLFKLMTEGSHPFDGVFNGPGEPPPLELRIAVGSLPWRNRTGLWAPRPLAMPIDALHPRLRELFVQCFEVGHRQPHLRPDARACQKALAVAEEDLSGCSHNPRHWIWGSRCFWCERTALLGGIDPFPHPSRRIPRHRPAAHRPTAQARTGTTVPVQQAPQPCQTAGSPRLWPLVAHILIYPHIDRSSPSQTGTPMTRYDQLRIDINTMFAHYGKFKDHPVLVSSGRAALLLLLVSAGILSAGLLLLYAALRIAFAIIIGLAMLMVEGVKKNPAPARRLAKNNP
jgi:hypothetical protein